MEVNGNREFEASGDLIKASKFAIGEQIKVKCHCGRHGLS